MRARRSGFALIVVLLGIAAVFALAMQGAVSARTTILEAGVLRDRVEGERGARSAAALALAGLFTMRPEDDDGLSGPGSGAGGSSADDDVPKPARELPPIIVQLLKDSGKDLEKEQERVEEERRARERADLVMQGGGLSGTRRGIRSDFRILQKAGLPPRPLEVTFEGRLYRISLSDAVGVLNINKADDAQLRRFFLAKGLDEFTARSLAEQILDWRDSDNFMRELGAERERYLVRGVVCRNAPIAALEELLYLPSMTAEIFDAIRRDLCLDSDGKIHAGSASRAVLMSIEGMTEDAAASIIELRSQGLLTRETLKRVIPVSRTSVTDVLRFEPSSILAIRVEMQGIGPAAGTARTFEGYVMVGEKGIEAMGLRPV